MTTTTVERTALDAPARPRTGPADGATVIVFRRDAHTTRYLLLHRADDAGWRPPSGRCRPSEPVKACASRRLTELSGLHLYPIPTAFGTGAWEVYLAQAVPGAEVTLAPDFDRFEWVDAGEAARRCGYLADSIGRVAALVEHR